MMKSCGYVLGLLFFIYCVKANGQSYHAANGSAYAGVLGNFTNPASGINSPFKWDVSIVGAQSITTNNALSIGNLDFNNLASTAVLFQPTSGTGNRRIDNNADLHLFNVRYAIDKIQCVSFGIRVRYYTHATASSFNFIDTTSGLLPFLSYNAGFTPFNSSVSNEAWVENDFSYARILKEDNNSRWSGGITIGLLRGISGFYGSINNLRYVSEAGRSVATGGGVKILYSDTYSVTDEGNTLLKNALKLKQAGNLSVGASVGVEYLVKKNVFDEPYNPKNYYWKIGFSIMDIGSNKFNTAAYSFIVDSPKTNVTDTGLINQIDAAYGHYDVKRVLINNFKGSLPYQSTFKMRLPTRLVLAIDKSFSSNFYVNAMLSLNIYNENSANIYKINTTELNLLVITPRWENHFWGFYMPVQYTATHNLFVGTAIKIGPLLIGLHNINWLDKSKIAELNGGSYVALHIQPKTKKLHHSLDCFYD